MSNKGNLGKELTRLSGNQGSNQEPSNIPKLGSRLETSSYDPKNMEKKNK